MNGNTFLLVYTSYPFFIWVGVKEYFRSQEDGDTFTIRFLSLSLSFLHLKISSCCLEGKYVQF